MLTILQSNRLETCLSKTLATLQNPLDSKDLMALVYALFKKVRLGILREKIGFNYMNIYKS
jgi:hypothetical protein